MGRSRGLSYRGEWLRIPPGEQMRCPCCLRPLRMLSHHDFVTYLRPKVRDEMGPSVFGGYSYRHERCQRLIEWYSERVTGQASH